MAPSSPLPARQLGASHGLLRLFATFVLALLAGYADVITYVRYGSFAASQTGNVIFLGRSLAEKRWLDSSFYGLTIGAWSAGSLAYHQVAWHSRWGGSMAAVGVAVIATGTDVCYNLIRGSRVKWWLLGLVPIFGVSEAFALAQLKLPTTGVAKHLSAIAKVPSLCRGGASDAEDILSSLAVLLGLTLGAVLGGVLAIYTVEVPWCFLPVAPMVACAICVHERIYYLNCPEEVEESDSDA
ncbi:unnamed protein product [Effrenium voratum]|nr:unnamed protein product [Effrenium voratum]